MEPASSSVEHLASSLPEKSLSNKHAISLASHVAGYAQGAAAGFACGAARGAAVALRALAPRVPDLAARLQDAKQQQAAQQPGPAGSQGSPTQQLEAMPYQKLQRRVCEALMAAPAGAGSAASSGDSGGGAERPQPAVLPDDVAAALRASRDAMQQLGLQAPPQGA